MEKSATAAAALHASQRVNDHSMRAVIVPAATARVPATAGRATNPAALVGQATRVEAVAGSVLV